MQLNDIVFQYNHIIIKLLGKRTKTFIFNVFKDDKLLGTIKWDYFLRTYSFFRIKEGEIETDSEWDFINYCVRKLSSKHYGGKKWILKNLIK